MKKMNNKGFSLVELIVVVLIMAIIAVALAPQVMKWVENSRKSNDIEAYNAVLEACNVAAADETVIAKTGTSKTNVIAMTKTSTTIQGSGDFQTAWATAIGRTLPVSSNTVTDTKITSGDWAGKTFYICAQKADGGVNVFKGSATSATAGTDYPVKDFS